MPRSRKAMFGEHAAKADMSFVLPSMKRPLMLHAMNADGVVTAR